MPGQKKKANTDDNDIKGAMSELSEKLTELSSSLKLTESRPPRTKKFFKETIIENFYLVVAILGGFIATIFLVTKEIRLIPTTSEVRTIVSDTVATKLAELDSTLKRDGFGPVVLKLNEIAGQVGVDSLQFVSLRDSLFRTIDLLKKSKAAVAKLEEQNHIVNNFLSNLRNLAVSQGEKEILPNLYYELSVVFNRLGESGYAVTAAKQYFAFYDKNPDLEPEQDKRNKMSELLLMAGK